jgi:hypothetical protein
MNSSDEDNMKQMEFLFQKVHILSVPGRTCYHLMELRNLMDLALLTGFDTPGWSRVGTTRWKVASPYWA